MKTKKIGMMLLLFVLLFSLIFNISTAFEVGTGTEYGVGNETYTFNHNMELSLIEIDLDGQWIKFNTTDFNITSTNEINITFIYINESTIDSGIGDNVLEFNATTSTGTVVFFIGGFDPSVSYIIKVDGVNYTTDPADVNGYVAFLFDDWDTYHIFQIEKGYFESPEEPEEPVESTDAGLSLAQYIPFIGLAILGVMLVVNFMKNPSLESGALVLVLVAVVIIIVTMSLMSLL